MTDKDSIARFEKDNTALITQNILQVIVGAILLLASFSGYSVLQNYIVVIPAMMGAILLFSGWAAVSKINENARPQRTPQVSSEAC